MLPPTSQIEPWINLPLPDTTPLRVYLFETVAQYQGRIVAISGFDCEVVE